MSAPQLLFSLGGLNIYLFGIMVSLGFLAGGFIALKRVRRYGLDQNKAFDLILYLLAGGLAGARLLYVALNWNDYSASPLSVFSLHQGGLSFHGAVLGGVITALIYARRQRISFLELGDAFAPGLMLGYAIGRIGCDIYGNVTNVPWAVLIEGSLRHPVQIYSALASFAIFILLWERGKNKRFAGEILLLMAGSYSVYRFIIEFFRYDAGGLSPAQYASMVITVAALAILALKNKLR